MDGSLAVVFLVVGLADMGWNYCETGCLAPRDDRGRGSLSLGSAVFQGDDIGDEIYGRYASMDGTRCHGGSDRSSRSSARR